MNILKKIKKNVPLSPMTTFKVGGPAKYFLAVENEDDLRAGLEWAEDNNIKVYFLGGGSNLLINDRGVEGLVIKLSNQDIKKYGNFLDCGAGALLNNALRLSVEHGLSGLEWSAGIPNATIGGAVRGNAEAFGQPMSGLVYEVKAFDRAEKEFKTFSRDSCGFSYRNSMFKQDRNLLIWQVKLEFSPADKNTIAQSIEKSLTFRQANYPKKPGAGSIFSNLSMEYVRERNKDLADQAIALGIARLGNIGAGLIIDKFLGLRGFTVGQAKISEEHANQIVNLGQARAEDIVILINIIKEKARNNLNLEFKEEIEYFGFN